MTGMESFSICRRQARHAALEADVLRAMASDPLVPYHALTDSTIQLTPAAAPLGDLNHA